MLGIGQVDYPTSNDGRFCWNQCLGVGGMMLRVSILLWLGVLSRLQVSVAYPFLSIGYVIAAIVDSSIGRVRRLLRMSA